MSTPRRIAIAVLSAALLLVWASPGAAAPENEVAPGYPTWEEVEAAKSSEQASRAEYERLQGALQRAQAEAAEASVTAIERAEAARQADTALTDAVAMEEQLAARLARARESLAGNSDALGRTVAWLYRDGTGLARYGELASSQDPEEFMAKLGAATQVTGTWNALVERAKEEVNAVSSLEDQASAARQEREDLAEQAGAARQEAEQVSQRAKAAASAAADRSDTVYAQLASLRDTTSDVERRYQLGLRVAEELRQQERERERAAEETPPSQPGGGAGPPGGQDPGVIVDPAGAQAYARQAMRAYGWGDDQFGCLVPLWNGESGWRADALNPSSGAYGIPQSLPAEKMAAAGSDWRTNGATQVDWGLAYIQAAYGTPCTAWNAWQSRYPRWY
ncbi:hypothetical protein [Leucobacter sp. wl10]|uniref:coiled-coil domain-containing protein n=1 Tax=Leucobacter sp. wl10 TaxID=2304677 RepID=UPI0013C2E73F|nr:hypothetical protein [Leucobacter sp. wl10]